MTMRRFVLASVASVMAACGGDASGPDPEPIDLSGRYALIFWGPHSVPVLTPPGPFAVDSGRLDISGADFEVVVSGHYTTAPVRDHHTWHRGTISPIDKEHFTFRYTEWAAADAGVTPNWQPMELSFPVIVRGDTVRMHTSSDSLPNLTFAR